MSDAASSAVPTSGMPSRPGSSVPSQLFHLRTVPASPAAGTAIDPIDSGCGRP
jgi:hypothetical protein